MTKIGINMFEITNPFVDVINAHGTPKFNLSEPLQMYFVGKTQVTTITNIEYRAASFLDWWIKSRCSLANVAGSCSGEHGRIRGFSISWPRLERETVFDVDRDKDDRVHPRGQSGSRISDKFAGHRLEDSKGLDCQAAYPRYYAESGNMLSLGRLVPFAALETEADTGHGMIPIEIHCPMIKEPGE